jgi:SAM-dependent methyltransferase
VTRNETVEAREELSDLLGGGPILHAIALASQLSIPDLLASRPRTAADLAQATGSHEDALYRVLRALASAGVLAERTGRRFALTPISQLLRTGVPGSMRSVAILAGEPWRRAWYDLPHAVRTGRPAFDRGHGASFYDWISTDRGAYRRFDEVQRYKWEALLEEVLRAYDFSQASRIVDVGGGSGTLIEAILAGNPEQTGVLVEAPVIATEARRRLRAAGLQRRCRVIAGDAVRAVPGDGDLYILAFVLHNWDDRAAVRILRNCRRAMTAGARVLVIESILPEDLQPSPAKLGDLEMLVFMAGGRERTRREYRALLESADLRLSRVIGTRTSASLIVAVAA